MTVHDYPHLYEHRARLGRASAAARLPAAPVRDNSWRAVVRAILTRWSAAADAVRHPREVRHATRR